MDTKKWGPPGWVFMHSIAENYDPTIHNAKIFKRFFTDIGDVLPCVHCRESYQKFIKELPIDPYLKTAGGLGQWLYLIHNKVNKKLRDQGYPIAPDPDFEKISQKYQNFKVNNCQNQDTCRSAQKVVLVVVRVKPIQGLVVEELF